MTATRALGQLSRVLTALERCVLAYGILGMAGLTVANVLLRATTGRSLAAAEELCQFALVWVTFLGISHAAAEGRHIRMSALYEALPHSPRRRARIAICLLTAGLLGALCWWAITYVGTVRALGTVSAVLQVPLWLVYLAAPTGLGLAGLQYLLAAWRNWRSSDSVYLSYKIPEGYSPPAEAL